jgi:RNA polymerase sigma factor (sigma-70 family)
MDLSDVFEKPGRDWSDDERAACVMWLFSAQLERLLVFTLHWLGKNSSIHDAHDAWMSFCLESLRRTVDTYDPTRGRRFPSYLHLCLQRHCARIRKKRLLRDEHERHLDGPEYPHYEFELRISGGARESDLHDRIECRDLLQKALNRMPSDLAIVIFDHHFMGHAISVIAERSRVPEGTMKMRLHRARIRMKEEIRQLEAPLLPPDSPGDVVKH